MLIYIYIYCDCKLGHESWYTMGKSADAAGEQRWVSSQKILACHARHLHSAKHPHSSVIMDGSKIATAF